MIAATRDPSSRQGNLLTSGQQRPEPAEGAHYDNIDGQCSLAGQQVTDVLKHLKEESKL